MARMENPFESPESATGERHCLQWTIMSYCYISVSVVTSGEVSRELQNCEAIFFFAVDEEPVLTLVYWWEKRALCVAILRRKY